MRGYGHGIDAVSAEHGILPGACSKSVIAEAVTAQIVVTGSCCGEGVVPTAAVDQVVGVLAVGNSVACGAGVVRAVDDSVASGGVGEALPSLAAGGAGHIRGEPHLCLGPRRSVGGANGEPIVRRISRVRSVKRVLDVVEVVE